MKLMPMATRAVTELEVKLVAAVMADWKELSAVRTLVTGLEAKAKPKAKKSTVQENQA